jgi:NAD(P) transhydrogenase subunit alpha
LTPGSNDDLLPALKERGLTALALELVPRISRAQSMDVLSSQSGVAGYKAVLVGASALDKFLPMLTTAAGSIAPAKTFVLGAGVAGLQAIATARRLGAVVSAFDVRSAAGEQVRSLGAQFVEPAAKAEGTGGYARAQTEDEAAQNAAIIADHIKSQDLVLTTALIPGRKAPILVTDAMLASMRPGSVVLDLAAESGGNVEGSVPGETVVRHGVQLIGVANIAASVPLHASQMFSTNVRTLLTHLSGENGALTVNAADEITGPMLVVHNGAVPVKAS